MAERWQPSAADVLRLALQRRIAALLVPLWTPLVLAAMRWFGGYTMSGEEPLRQHYRAARREGAPLLLCPNHLTLLDPLIVGWAAGSLGDYARDRHAVPWVVLASENALRVFPPGMRWLGWPLKTIAIPRGGDRHEIAKVLGIVRYLLSLGDSVLIFTEGRRSPRGRVAVGAGTYGVGRILGTLPDCRVLCVHVRGIEQDRASDLPTLGTRFHTEYAELRPHSDASGLKRALDLNRQVLEKLADLERLHFEYVDRVTLAASWDRYPHSLDSGSAAE